MGFGHFQVAHKVPTLLPFHWKRQSRSLECLCGWYLLSGSRRQSWNTVMFVEFGCAGVGYLTEEHV
jgi:hypothetical protein